MPPTTTTPTKRRRTGCRCCGRMTIVRRGTEPKDTLCAWCRSGPHQCPYGVDHGVLKYASCGGTVR